MPHLNVEIKARTGDPEKIRKLLKNNKAKFIGTDHQIDTYFKVPRGRLKLREGKIENFLIYYERENKKGPKLSKIILYKTEPEPVLKEILPKVLDVLVVVDKKREIYFIDNVKFHLDVVKTLGSFVEIEAIDKTGKIGDKKLLLQCHKYLELFGISDKNLIPDSYSDLLLIK